jgi:hypothetical protein
MTEQGVVEQSFEAVTVTFAAADPTHRHVASKNNAHLSGYRSFCGNDASFVNISFSLREVVLLDAALQHALRRVLLRRNVNCERIG